MASCALVQASAKIDEIDAAPKGLTRLGAAGDIPNPSSQRASSTSRMPHPTVENRTPFAFEALHSLDEDGRPLLVVVVRGSFALARARLVLAEQQTPVPLAGELFADDVTGSSWRHEPEAAFVKLATDVVLIGHAYPSRAGGVEGTVSFQVGPVSRAAHVTGDRMWLRSSGAISMTRPTPFDRIPIRWERSFGGVDETAAPPGPGYEARNPIGTGYRSRNGRFEDGVRLPNFEDPSARITTWGQLVVPVGFGFTSPGWQPRAAFAGTYDEAWRSERMPLLARDFDRRAFNAAAPGLVAPGYLRGDEPVNVVGASPFGSLSFKLPGVPPPVAEVGLRAGASARVETRLDTVVIDTDEERVFLTWRGHLPVPGGPHDVRGIRITPPGLEWSARAGRAR